MVHRKKLSDKELLELGKKLEQFYEHGYVNKKQALTFSFYKGMASGLGAILGGTILVVLLIWILSLFHHVPILGHFVEVLNRSLQKN